jgi:hypothetical protein
MEVPQNGWVIMENLVKMDDLGYPHFRKPPDENCPTLFSIRLRPVPDHFAKSFHALGWDDWLRPEIQGISGHSSLEDEREKSC